MSISNYELQGAETMSNPNLVFSIVPRINMLYYFSTTLCRDRQVLHTMNMYRIMALIASLVITLQIISRFHLNSLKTIQIH